MNAVSVDYTMKHGYNKSLWEEEVLDVLWRLDNTINKGKKSYACWSSIWITIRWSVMTLRTALSSDQVGREIDVNVIRMYVDRQVAEN